MSKDYSQPAFYRFNEDSVLLRDHVKTKINSAQNILDLGAGCGILGIEVSNILKAQTLDLLELQKDFLPYLESNVSNFLNSSTRSNIIIDSFANFKPLRKWDLIISNPPYYLEGRGEPSKDERRFLARTFIKDGWGVFLRLIAKCLIPEGSAFVVIKKDTLLLYLIKEECEKANLSVEISRNEKLCFLLFRLNENRN